MINLQKIYITLQVLGFHSMPWYFKERKRASNKAECIANIDLTNVLHYCRRNTYAPSSKGDNKVVLIEMLNSKFAANFRVCLIWMLLARKNKAKAIGLTEIGEKSAVKKIAQAFGINQFIGVYKVFDFINIMKSSWSALKFYINTYANPEMLISYSYDGQLIGDLIYDEYLRLTGEPTVSKVDACYLALVYRSIYRYHRYKSIIKNYSVTDIVLTHNVYAKYGLLIKAAASCDKKIKYWTATCFKPVSISWNYVVSGGIPKAQYYKEEYGDLIRKVKTDSQIKKEYMDAIEKRMGGDDTNQWDVRYAYKGNEIVNDEGFNCEYGLDNKAIFIMVHVFVDAVRYPQWQIYKDNYTWLRETMLALVGRSKKEKIFIKPHPSEIDDRYMYCKATVQGLVEEINSAYGSEFIYLNKKIHNRVILSLAKVIITSHGTIGAEAPCFGVPVIVASSCHYEAAGAIFQAKDRKEYEDYLIRIDDLPALSDEQIHNAKIAFLWLNKYVFVDSEILPDLRPLDYEDDRGDLVKIIKAFDGARSLGEQELYQVFSEMVDSGHHDFISVH